MPKPAPSPVPDGMSTVTPQLWFAGNCAEAIEFYTTALDAAKIGEVVPSPNGAGVWHAMLRIGDSNVMLADAAPSSWESGPDTGTSVGFFLYVDNCDTWYQRAVDAGCEVIDPIDDMFWGDRVGKVKDPFGHTWAFATHRWVYTEEEMAAAIGG